MSDTIQAIRSRMLERIPKSYDRSEGSFFYDVLQAAAMEMAAQVEDLAGILDKGFVLTADGSYLDRKVAEQGITRKAAARAGGTVTIYGQPGASIAKGTKVASDTLLYMVTENKIIGETACETVTVACDEFGTIGNCPPDTVKFFPVTIPGLAAVTNMHAFSNGYDGESDDELRQRYLYKVRTPSTSGNQYHYQNWAKEISGVGDARVFPLWNGNGTVKVILINSDRQPAPSELVAEVARHIESVRPIGATVTVAGALPLNIDITVALTLSSGYTGSQVKGFITENLTDYLQEIAFKENTVSYARIGSIILDTEGVYDYSGLTVNGGIANLTVNNEQVAVLGVINLS